MRNCVSLCEYFMRTLFIILLLFAAGKIFPQQYAGKIKHAQTTSPEILAHSLTANCTNDVEKVRAIFSWVAENIEYNTGRKNYSKNISFVYPQTLIQEDTNAIQSANEFVAVIVLNNRTARCEGYSRLFKVLCDYAGVHSEIVTGYARGSGAVSSRFVSNHFWNAVFVDSAWHLLDVTWASGSISFFSDRFIKMYNDYYFFTSPDQFIHDHYPDDLKWTLLPHPPQIDEFRHSPFKPSAYIKYDIHSFKPTSGIIEAAPGDTVEIELETTPVQLSRLVATDTLRQFNGNMFFADSSVVSLQPSTVVEDKKVRYSYIVNSAEVEWLQVLYNNDVVLRYRLKIKKVK
jgi:hypothetical protein